jgi:hypothetical protein
MLHIVTDELLASSLRMTKRRNAVVTQISPSEDDSE